MLEYAICLKLGGVARYKLLITIEFDTGTVANDNGDTSPYFLLI